jgi:hypothetical protein
MNTGTLFVKNPNNASANWVETNIPYVWVIAALGYTEAIYVKLSASPDGRDYKLNLLSSDVNLNLGLPWCSQTGCMDCGACDGDDSNPSIDNLPKRAMSVRDQTGAFGSFEPVSSSSGTLDDMYTYTYTRSNYVLKLFIPESTKPTSSYGGYDFSNFETDPNLINYYLDSDGDNMPNYWDLYPEYPDADMNGILDGIQTSPVTLISTPESIAYGGEALTNILVSMPFNFDGTLSANVKTTSALKAYTPQVTSVPTAINGGLYYLNGSTLIRKVPTWDIDPITALNQKSRFIHGTVTGSSITLDESLELNALINSNGPFTNRVINY